MSKPIAIQTREAVIQRAADAAADPENRTYEFVISTETPDSYGTVFRMDGWMLDRYLRNPIVCYGHNAGYGDPDTIIGRGEVFVEEGKLMGRVHLEEGNTLADKLKRKIDNGLIRMASVGAIVHKAHRGDKDKNEDPDLIYFTRQELAEWSIVGIGSNPDAHKRNAQTIEELSSAFAKAEQRNPDKNNTPVLDEYEARFMFNSNNSK